MFTLIVFIRITKRGRNFARHGGSAVQKHDHGLIAPYIFLINSLLIDIWVRVCPLIDHNMDLRRSEAHRSHYATDQILPEVSIVTVAQDYKQTDHVIFLHNSYTF